MPQNDVYVENYYATEVLVVAMHLEKVDLRIRREG